MNFFPDDIPVWTNSLKVLTKEQLAIPNLYMMGHVDFDSCSMKLKNHYHNTMEITVLLSGTQQYYVNDTLYTLHGGDMFMTRPQEPHGYNDCFQDVCEYVWFQFDLSSPGDNFLGLPQPHSDYVYQQMLQYNQRVKPAQKKYLQRLRDSFFSLASPEPHQRLAGYNSFLQFVIHNLCCPDPVAEAAGHNSDIQTALIYIHTHLYEEIDIDTIAAYIGLSPSRFKVKFKNELGITPHAYITTQKINVAKSLLKDPNNSVTGIAYKLNFSSSNHFSSVFKKYTGYTPSEYKEGNL